jgi:hypothetical protein
MGANKPGLTSARKACALAWLVAVLALAGCDYGPEHEAGACTFGPPCAAQAGAGSALGGGAPVPGGVAQSGVGDAVLRLPPEAETVRVQASSLSGDFAVFSVYANSVPQRAVTLGAGATVPTSDDVLRVPAGAVLELRGPAVAWTVTEVMPLQVQSATLAGLGAAVLRMPAFGGLYQVQASYPGDFGMLVLTADGVPLTGAPIGRQQVPPAYSGQWRLQGGTVLQVVVPPGASWQVREVGG